MQRDYVVAVPAHAPADVQQQLGHKGQNRRDFVRDDLCGVKVPAVQAQEHLVKVGRCAPDVNDVLLCLDSGHFHPTEVISDKLSAILAFVPQLLLHISRGVRWDSDHVVTLNDELRAIAQELVRGAYLERVHIGLDFFDASINRVAAWVIGTRNALRALLMALLEPLYHLRGLELAGDYTGRLALLEALKSMPFGAVWDYFCLHHAVPIGIGFMDEIRAFEKREFPKRA